MVSSIAVEISSCPQKGIFRSQSKCLDATSGICARAARGTGPRRSRSPTSREASARHVAEEDDAHVSEVFISYAPADRDFVRRVHDALEASGRRAWIDWRDIPPTADWIE